MSNPSDGTDAPLHFENKLYDMDIEVLVKDELCMDYSYDESREGENVYDVSPSPTAAPYSPLPTPHPGHSAVTPLPPYFSEDERARSRSRSPHRAPEPLAFVLTNAEYGEELTADCHDYEPDTSILHEMSVRMRGRSIVARDPLGASQSARGISRGRSVREGVRGARVRQSPGHGARRQIYDWQPGQPLTEMYLTDDDFPPEVLEMARDVARKRPTRVEEQEARSVSTGLEKEDSDDAFEGAIGGRGNPLHFEWSPMETFRCAEEEFKPKGTGSVNSYKNPYDAFRSYWDDGILQVIVDETNRNASRISSAAFQSEWHPTNAHELLCLFAFWVMTGIIRMPTINSYFANNSLLKTEVFSFITTLKRYTVLIRALNFMDTGPTDAANPTSSGAASSDRIYLLRPIIDQLNSKFQSNYVPSKDICIDESLVLWKGNLHFRKSAQFGINTIELCESATGYLWSFLVHTGKQSSFDLGADIPESTAVVLKLMDPLLNKGYRLFMKSCYNSPHLARILKRNGTDCVGALRPSRVEVPWLVAHAPLKQGQLLARHSGDVCVLSWQDKRRITMISTCHGSGAGLPTVSSKTAASPVQFKPQSVLDYNRSMAVHVDLNDQMLEPYLNIIKMPYLLKRKRCAEKHLKLFKCLLNCSIHNSRVLLESSLKAEQDNLVFRLALVNAILYHHHSLIPLNPRVG